MTPSQIADTLQTDILSGALPPGAPLGQVELAARFGVSRIPVRDALALLAAQGVITACANHTATVLALSPDEVDEIFAIRLLLECDLLARSVDRMRDAELDALDRALERSEQMVRQDGNWADADQMFHAALYAPAGRPRQQHMVDELRRASRVQIAAHPRLARRSARWLSEHAEIVTACRAGNAKEAQRLLRRHLRATRNHLLKAMGA